MKTVQLGQSDLQTTRLIYGCMRLPGTWDRSQIDETRKAEAFAALEAAVEAGYNHFDHADIYARGVCEEIFGAFLKSRPRLRDDLIVTTKVGIRFPQDTGPDAPHRYDFSAEYIQESCEGSLKRLGVETIDVYLLHRPDVLMNPDEVAEAFGKLKAAGKVRYFGVSNFTPSQTALLQSRLDEPLVCNQIEVHPLRLEPFEDGTLDDLYQRGITPTSWSPIAGGRLGDPPAATSEAPYRLLAALDAEARALGISRTALIMAWLMAHPSGILPIVGSRQAQRIQDAAAADDVTLSREAWYRILLAARGRPLP